MTGHTFNKWERTDGNGHASDGKTYNLCYRRNQYDGKFWVFNYVTSGDCRVAVQMPEAEYHTFEKHVRSLAGSNMNEANKIAFDLIKTDPRAVDYNDTTGPYAN